MAYKLRLLSYDLVILENLRIFRMAYNLRLLSFDPCNTPNVATKS